MLKLVFRFLFLGLGLFILYTFGRSTLEPVWYRLTGTAVEGRISGFLAGRYGPSVQPEAEGVRNGKKRARRPVFRYPRAAGATDSLEGRSNSSGFRLLGNYRLHERVTVVFAPGDPQHAYLFGGQVIATSFLITLLGLYLLRLGVLGRI